MKGVVIQLNAKSQKKINAIFQAEACLREAGIDFDTGYYFPTGTREWFLDTKVKGIKLRFTDD